MPFLAAIPVLTGAVAATSITGMLMIGGAALGTIGMLTGNENLTKIGGYLGLAGGISGLASGAFSSGASAAEGASGSAVANTVTPAADSIAETVAGTGVADTASELANVAGTNAVQGASQNVANLGTGYEGISDAAASGNWGPGAAVAPPSSQVPFMDKLANTWNAMGDKSQAAAIQVGGGAVKGAFSAIANTPEKRMAALREKQLQEEMRLKANQSRIPDINIAMNPQAALYYRGVRGQA